MTKKRREKKKEMTNENVFFFFFFLFSLSEAPEMFALKMGIRRFSLQTHIYMKAVYGKICLFKLIKNDFQSDRDIEMNMSRSEHC